MVIFTDLVKERNKLMKRLLCLIIAAVICLSFAACSKTPGNDNTTAQTTTQNTITEQTTEQTTKAVKKTEKTVDAVAEYLGFSDGEEQFYSMIGAKDGKAFNGGELEIYLFDENSEEYKSIIAGNGTVTATAYKEGVILVFPNTVDQDIVNSFNDIEFK